MPHSYDIKVNQFIFISIMKNFEFSAFSLLEFEPKFVFFISLNDFELITTFIPPRVFKHFKKKIL